MEAEGTLRSTPARSAAAVRRGSAVARLNRRRAASGRRARWVEHCRYRSTGVEWIDRIDRAGYP